MLGRRYLGALVLAGVFFPLTSCTTSPGLSYIVIAPAAPTVTLALESNGSAAPVSEQLPTQYQAIGYYTHPGHPPEMKDLSSQVKWYTDSPELVTISSSGLAMPTTLAVGYGDVYASMPGFNGLIVSNASTYTVDLPSSFETSDVTSISIQPSSPSLTAAAGTAEGFAAIGTTGTGETVNLSASSKWSSSDTAVFQFNGTSATGKVTGYGQTAIVVTYTNRDGLQVTAYTILINTNPNS